MPRAPRAPCGLVPLPGLAAQGTEGGARLPSIACAAPQSLGPRGCERDALPQASHSSSSRLAKAWLNIYALTQHVEAFGCTGFPGTSSVRGGCGAATPALPHTDTRLLGSCAGQRRSSAGERGRGRAPFFSAGNVTSVSDEDYFSPIYIITGFAATTLSLNLRPQSSLQVTAQLRGKDRDSHIARALHAQPPPLSAPEGRAC